MIILSILVCFLPCIVNSANILILDTVPSPSHHIWIRTLGRALAERGHNVTSLSLTIEEETPENFHYLHLDKVYDVFKNPEDEDYIMELDIIFFSKLGSYLQTIMLLQTPTLLAKGCVRSSGLEQLLAYPDDFKFDLVIYDFMLDAVMLPFVQKFNYPPVIAATACYSADYAADISMAPLNPSYSKYLFYYGDINAFWGRLNNFILSHLGYFIKQYVVAPQVNAILRKKIPWAKDITELKKLTKIILLNKYPALDFNEPALPNVISVGGLQIQRNKGHLPKEFQEIMDFAKEGVILFSLGTNINVSELGDVRVTEILEAFRSLPEYTFLWKVDGEILLKDIPPNVLIKKWFPQSELLAHPKLKLFISHCGLLSFQEAVWYGVPILGLPFIIDQIHNMQFILSNGMGLQGDIYNIDRHSFRTLIEEMLKNPKYRENTKIRSTIFKDQKETPMERAVWWTEFVMRHPNMTFMRSQSFDFSLPVRQSWDVMTFLCFIFFLSFLIFMKVVWYIFRFCNKKWKKVKKE